MKKDYVEDRLRDLWRYGQVTDYYIYKNIYNKEKVDKLYRYFKWLEKHGVQLDCIYGNEYASFSPVDLFETMNESELNELLKKRSYKTIKEFILSRFL